VPNFHHAAIGPLLKVTQGEHIMSVERITFAIVGILIMATVGGYLATQIEYFLYGTAVVGFMVFQAAFTSFCPVPMLLKMMGVRTGSVFG
jgi:hypothetical protein